jgi:putative protease
VTDERRVELLAPAGDGAALNAALAAGADAVYLGLDRWSARAFAGNFAEQELVPAIKRAHLYDARVHLALNTLLKDDEIEPALTALAAPYAAGLDALIVADLGFAALVRERYPELALHASTQLNTHSSAQLAALAGAGFARAILARELTLDEIAALRDGGVQREVFVHGALCYGYSGLCLFSSMVGGRSGNRGRCSQACRMRYRLLSGERETSVERTLSTADLAAIGSVGRLVSAGVVAFKIEGRMKDAGYVATTTAVYREALDAALADPDGYAVQPEWMARLEQSYSRGFTAAHLEGRHSEVRSPGRGGHRGVLVGRVESLDDENGLVTVRLNTTLTGGDVVQLYTPWGHSEPTRVAAAAQGGGGGRGEAATWEGQVVLRVRERVAVKDRLFRLSSGEADEFAREAVAGRRLARPVALRGTLGGRAGEPARLTLALLHDDAGIGPVDAATDFALEPARTARLDATKARAAVGALGGTPYTLEEFAYEVTDDVFLGVGALKDLRRRAVAELDERRLATWRRTAGAQDASSRRRPARSRSSAEPLHGSGVRPLVAPGAGRRGDVDLVPVVLRLGVRELALVAPGVAVYCLDVGSADTIADVTAARNALRAHGLPVHVRAPEVLFDEDESWWQGIVALDWDGIYARHVAHLEVSVPVTIEYPLQGLNALAAERLRPAGVVASPEASLEEIAGLAAALRDREPKVRLEALAFGRQQVMYTRDRLGRAEGFVDDDRPAASLSLLDTKGFVFPALVDGRGTRIFNARLTNLAPHLADLVAAGVDVFIVVQADQAPAEAGAFAAHGLAGLAAFAARDRSTTGHLFRGVV